MTMLLNSEKTSLYSVCASRALTSTFIFFGAVWQIVSDIKFIYVQFSLQAVQHQQLLHVPQGRCINVKKRNLKKEKPSKNPTYCIYICIFSKLPAIFASILSLIFPLCSASPSLFCGFVFGCFPMRITNSKVRPTMPSWNLTALGFGYYVSIRQWSKRTTPC